MIDLHCHLLPEVDDGPATLAESLALANELAADGTRIVVATPHVRLDHPAVVPSELASRASDVQQAIQTAGIGLEVRPGGELDLSRGLEADDEELQLVSLGQGGAWLLVETPYGPLTSFFERQLFELAMRGYHVLLAHPERNSSFHSNVERLEAIVARGVAVQLTASALLRPPRRSRTGALARTMLARGLAHVLASDAHGGSIGRGTLSAGLEVARELIGPGADSLVEDAPAAILAGEDPPALPAPATGGRGGGLLRRLRR